MGSDPGDNTLDSGIGTDGDSGGPNVLQAVSIAYRALGASLQAFLATPVDENDLEASAVATASKLPQVRKDYDYFHLVVSGIASDDQLGTKGAPSLEMLQTVDRAVGEWVAVREAYLGALSSCFGSGDPLTFLDCQEPIFARYETQLVETAKAAGLAIQAVDTAGQ